MAAFDFAFGLGRGSIAEADAIEVQSGSELGEGIRCVGEEKGVVIDVEDQGQSVGLESAGQEVQMSQERFVVIEAGAGVKTGGIIEQIQQDLFVGGLGQEGVGAGIVLPERAVVTGLPAFDRFADGFEAGIGCQAIWDGPAANAGAVGFEVEAAMQFAGGSAVGGRRFGGKEFGEQRGDFWRPRRTVVAPGTARGPSVGLSLGAGPQILAVEFVEAWTGQSQFLRGGEG